MSSAMAAQEPWEDHYAFFEISQTATFDSIKTRYYHLALCLHPDKNPGKPEATASFQRLQRAYEIGGDADKRREYDVKWYEHRAVAHQEALRRQAEAAKAERRRAAKQAMNKQSNQKEAVKQAAARLEADLARQRQAAARRSRFKAREEQAGRASKKAHDVPRPEETQGAHEQEVSRHQADAADTERQRAVEQAQNEKKTQEEALKAQAEAAETDRKRADKEARNKETEDDQAFNQAAMLYEAAFMHLKNPRLEPIQPKPEEKPEHSRSDSWTAFSHSAKDTADETAGKTKGTAADADADVAGAADEAAEGAKDTADDAKDQAEDVANDATEGIGDAHQTMNADLCRHRAYCSKLNGRRMCEVCQDILKFAYQCPGCNVVACDSCRRILKDEAPKTNSGKGSGVETDWKDQADSGKDDDYW
ncbi:MAG: hypothetical protein Q9218_003661 [Villophora microphyllina]